MRLTKFVARLSVLAIGLAAAAVLGWLIFIEPFDADESQPRVAGVSIERPQQAPPVGVKGLDSLATSPRKPNVTDAAAMDKLSQMEICGMGKFTVKPGEEWPAQFTALARSAEVRLVEKPIKSDNKDAQAWGHY
jgi:hypothetical protein